MAYLAYWENRLRPWYRIEKNTEKIAVQRSEQSERASKRVSAASERANGRASGQVFKSGFLVNGYSGPQFNSKLIESACCHWRVPP